MLLGTSARRRQRAFRRDVLQSFCLLAAVIVVIAAAAHPAFAAGQCEAAGNVAEISASPLQLAFASQSTSTDTVGAEQVKMNHFCYKLALGNACAPGTACCPADASSVVPARIRITVSGGAVLAGALWQRAQVRLRDVGPL